MCRRGKYAPGHQGFAEKARKGYAAETRRMHLDVPVLPVQGAEGQQACVSKARIGNAAKGRGVHLDVPVLLVQGAQRQQGVQPLQPRLPDAHQDAAGVGHCCFSSRLYRRQPQRRILHATGHALSFFWGSSKGKVRSQVVLSKAARSLLEPGELMQSARPATARRSLSRRSLTSMQHQVPVKPAHVGAKGMRGERQAGQGTLSGQAWCGMPGCMSRADAHSSIRPCPADTPRSAHTCMVQFPMLNCKSLACGCRPAARSSTPPVSNSLPTQKPHLLHKPHLFPHNPLLLHAPRPGGAGRSREQAEACKR